MPVYAQPGSGRRAPPLTDYTFAVRAAAGERVPFAKAYCGLSDEELREVDRCVATRFPHIARRRRDKPASEADTLATLKAPANRHAGVDAGAAPSSQAAEP